MGGGVGGVGVVVWFGSEEGMREVIGDFKVVVRDIFGDMGVMVSIREEIGGVEL